VFVTPAEFRSTFNPGTYLSIFDDNNDGIVADDDPNVALVLERAHSKVVSYLPLNFRSWAELSERLPAHAPILLKGAELDFGFCLAMDRHPEFAKTYGGEERDKRWKRAEGEMDRVARAMLRLVEVPETPTNVGGLVRSSDPHDPSRRRRLFTGKTGIF